MKRILSLVLVLALLAVTGAAFAQDDEDDSLVFWSTETEPSRAEITRNIIDQFTEETGIEVDLVLTEEDVLPSLMTSNLAAGTLPDVIFHPTEFTTTWVNQGILSPEAATSVITDLGEEHFSALGLVESGDGQYNAVPSDGWGQLLIYRQDLFDEAGLERPTDFESIMTAAETLHDPDNDFFGIVAATDPNAVFTQQTFEHFALANGVDLTDDEGNVTLNTPEMVEALDFYSTLVGDYGPAGTQDVVSTRATYFAGQAAMIVWSPFILDEMAGLRDAAMPACPECEDDPAYLAKNSGIVPAFVGPNGENPAQYGQVSNMGISTSAPESAQTFVKYWLTDGYVDWLRTSPEGKFPMHRGDDENPTRYIEAWSDLETGVDREAPLSEFYSEEVIQTLIEGASNFARWGFTKGQGELVGGVYQELPIPLVISDILNGSFTPEEAAEEAQFLVEEIQAGLAPQE